MLAQGKPLNRNKFSLMSSRSARVDGNLSKSPNFVVKACVTRRTTRLTVDSSNPRKLPLITCRNEPEARNLRVMKRTYIIVETAWFLSFVVFFFVRNKVNDVLYWFSSKTIHVSKFRVSIRLLGIQLAAKNCFLHTTLIVGQGKSKKM